MIYTSEDIRRIKIDLPTLLEKAERFFILFKHYSKRRRGNALASTDSRILFIPLEELDTPEINKKLESLGYEDSVIIDLRKL